MAELSNILCTPYDSGLGRPEIQDQAQLDSFDNAPIASTGAPASFEPPVLRPDAPSPPPELRLGEWQAGSLRGSQLPAASQGRGKGRLYAGVRRKPYGDGDRRDKRRQDRADGIDNTTAPTGRGRRVGVANYREEEVAQLLNIVEDLLPTGAKGWAAVGARLRIWAKDRGYPQRHDKSVESKFKQLVKTTKPTGTGECPPNIERAHVIEDMINTRIGTRDLDDEDIVYEMEEITGDEQDVGDEEGGEDTGVYKDAQPLQVKAIRRESSIIPAASSAPFAGPRPRTRNTTGPGFELLNKISNSLDPAVQAAAASERAAASFQNAQVLNLNHQIREQDKEIRDLLKEISDLRAQLSDAQAQSMHKLHEARYKQHEAEQRASRAEQQTQLSQMLNEAMRGRSLRTPSPRRRRDDSNTPRRRRRRSSIRSTPRRRFEVRYADGGRRSYWGYPEDAPEPRSSPAFSYTEVHDSPSRPEDTYRGPESRRHDHHDNEGRSHVPYYNNSHDNSGAIIHPAAVQPVADTSASFRPSTPSEWAPSPMS